MNGPVRQHHTLATTGRVGGAGKGGSKSGGGEKSPPKSGGKGPHRGKAPGC